MSTTAHLSKNTTGNLDKIASDYLVRVDSFTLAHIANQLGLEKDGKERSGGVLVVEVLDLKEPGHSNTCSLTVGAPGLNVSNNAFYVHEKIRRLRNIRSEGGGDYSSSQSADPSQGKYGGAVVGLLGETTEIYISYSGAPAEVDEALSYILAKSFGLTVSDDYKNPMLDRARELCAES